MPLPELDELTFELKMLAEHGVKFLSHPPYRCSFCRYQDMLYFLRHVLDGVAFSHLFGICNISTQKWHQFLDKALNNNHIEGKKRKNYRILDKGIEYNILWFAVQDRFNIRDRVPSTFKIDDVPRDEKAIEFLMARDFSENLDRKSCYRWDRDSCTQYLDPFRILNKHKNGVIQDHLIRRAGITNIRYQKFEEIAIAKGHIEYSEEKTSEKGKPYVRATEEGLLLPSVVNWLVRKADMGDYVPSIVC